VSDGKLLHRQRTLPTKRWWMPSWAWVVCGYWVAMVGGFVFTLTALVVNDAWWPVLLYRAIYQ
jgi:hypothetical protein